MISAIGFVTSCVAVLSLLPSTMTVPDAAVPAALGILDAVQEMQIRDLLRSHLPPPSHLPSMLSALVDKLEQYDIEIACLQEKLRRLLSERAVFQRQYDDCNGLLAPIRRLPAEILVDIFEMCSDDHPWIPLNSDLDSVTSTIAMARLAHASFLNLSRVCVRWHSVALDTPTFWRQIDLDGHLWTDPAHSNSAMVLLRSALDRSANHPLVVTIVNVCQASPHLPALELLAQHSARWKTATFVCPFSDVVNLSMIKGNLPSLIAVEIYCWGPNAAHVIEIFQDPPLMNHVYFYRNADCIALFPLLPLEQIAVLWYIDALRNELPTIIPLLQRLPRVNMLVLRLSLGEHDPGQGFPSDGHLVSSDVKNLYLEIFDSLPVCARQALEIILASMTLPSLQGMSFRIAENTPHAHLPIPWPHLEFLSLSERSSFPTHLLELNLFHVIIPEAELFQALAALTSLQRLSITDQTQLPMEGSVEHVLITDTLLTALTVTPDSLCLVPALVRLHCKSMLRFDDNVFLKFILSRLPELPRSPPFKCELWWLPGHSRRPDALAAEKIRELQAKGKLVFSFVLADW